MENNSEFTERERAEDIPFTNMSGGWMPWEHGFTGWRSRRKLSKQQKKKSKADKKEFRSAVAGMYLAMLPMFLCVLLAFGLMGLLLALWLM